MGGPAMIEGGGLGVFRPEEVGPMAVQVPNGVVDIAVGRRGRGRRRGQALPVVLPGPAHGVGVPPTSAGCARSSPRTGCASTTCARSSRRWPTPARCSSCGAASASGMVTVAGPHRGASHRHRGQQPDPPRRGHRQRRRRQGGPLHAAVRRLRPAAAVPVRHARDDGGPRGGEDRPGPALQPHVRHGSQPDRAVLHHRAAQGVRPRRPGHGRRQLQGADVHGGLADRRVRRDGPRGRR